jgi:membrane-bound serine protease (ClpP class)
MRYGGAACLVVSLCVLGTLVRADSRAGGEAVVIDVDGAIGPATSAYVADAIQDAVTRAARLLILRLDTPGGLDTAMRAIVKAINASSVTVVGFVAPSGARAASAGTYILYACHVAAMAPGTNLGAATPIQLGGIPGGERSDKPKPQEGDDGHAAGGSAMEDKLVNDAAAYLRSLAQLRGRNAEWAETAVRSAASLPAEEAVQLGVVDLLASDLGDLLVKLDGRPVRTAAGEVTLATRGLSLTEHAPNWQIRLLSIISNPNVAYILMLVGIYGLIYEFSNPGAVLPGVAGAVSLVLALYAFQLLPVNFAGIALMLLGLALMVAEAFVPSFGALGVGGVVSFVLGSLILIDTQVPGFGLSIPLILTFAVASAVLLVLIVGMAVQARRRPVVSGAEELLVAKGVALSGFPGPGSVRLRGEVWSAHSEVAIAPGQPVRVIGREGLVLLVVPLNHPKES